MEQKILEENQKKQQKEKEILEQHKKTKESAYLLHLRNNAQLLFPKITNNKESHNDKKGPETKKTKTPTNNQKRASSVKKPGVPENNIDALDLDIHQSTENLKKILRQYKKEEQDNYSKVVDDFVTNLEHEINSSQKKNPFLDSLDLGGSGNEKKIKEIKNGANQTFGVKKIDFNDCKIENEFDKQSLEELIGYESENDENEKKQEEEEKKNKNVGYSKPFSANNVSRNEIINTSKPLKTENNAFGKNGRFSIIENQKHEAKNTGKNVNESKHSIVRDLSSKINENKTPPKSQNSQRRAPSYEPKTKMEKGKNQQMERNSKFKNKLFEDIENSKKIKETKNFENPIVSQKKDKISKEEYKPKSDHVKNFFLFI